MLAQIYERLRRVGDPADRANPNLTELQRARARTALAICPCEQASLDAGNWDLARRWLHLPEPSFTKLSNVQPERSPTVHATGVDVAPPRFSRKSCFASTSF